LLRDNLQCTFCTAPIERVVLTLDHLKGRHTHDPKTLVACCWYCNSSRQEESVPAFCRRKGLSYTAVRKRIRRQTSKDLAPFLQVAQLLLANGRSVPPWWTAQLIGAKDAAMRRRRGGDLEEEKPPEAENVQEAEAADPCPWCPSLCAGCAGSPARGDPLVVA
jgi:hypothetical protein